MDRIRIGNDFSMTWELGVDIPEGAMVELQAVSHNCTHTFHDFTLEGRNVSFTWPGRLQENPGVYSLKLTVNRNQEGMMTYDLEDAFELVTRSRRSNVGTITSTTTTRMGYAQDQDT